MHPVEALAVPGCRPGAFLGEPQLFPDKIRDLPGAVSQPPADAAGFLLHGNGESGKGAGCGQVRSGVLI